MAEETQIRIDERSVGVVETRYFHCDGLLPLESGQTLGPFTLAYEAYGALNDARDNAILLLHALSGDAHAAGYHADDLRKPRPKPGWWDEMVGPGKAFDTARFFVVCANVIGGCMGSTGPSSINPATGQPYATDFPVITIGDMVNAQKLLMDHLAIPRWYAVSGGSMGGMQALRWAVAYPDCVARCIPIATTHRLSAQSIAFDAVGRAAIMSDPNWQNGHYYGTGKIPASGLAVARMVGHITYLSEQSMHEKFGRQLRDADAYTWDFDPEFSVETYLQYQGDSFVKRFDANSYLYITKAMDYFDMGAGYDALAQALEPATARFLVLSFSSDWLFTTAESKDIVRALRWNGVDVSFMELRSSYGHDAFLLEAEEITRLVKGFLS
ncbi:MAG TPA: homoserine O-acetyltransferase [Armatimonadota bacterium]|nr:homoserine O-acetyltransferase [Armatimonadota bacterium]